MNYQLLLEYYSSGSDKTKDELQKPEIELYAQIESIKLSRTQGYLKLNRNTLSGCSCLRGYCLRGVPAISLPLVLSNKQY